MAITARLLSNGGATTTTNGTSYDTGTLDPAADKLLLVAVVLHQGATRNLTVTGCDVTWTQVAELASTGNKIVLLRACDAAPSSGAATLAVDGANIGGISYAFVEFDGTAATAANNGSDGIVATNVETAETTAGTSCSITMDAFQDATNNAVFAAFFHEANEVTTHENGWTELFDSGGINNPNIGFMVQWLLGEDTSASASWATTSDGAGIGVEIVAASAGGAFEIDAQPAAYTVTGAAAGALAARILNAAPGSYAFTGAAAGLLAGRVLNAGPGSYAVTGADAGLLAARVLSADPGAYVLTGVVADLVYGQGAQAFEIDAQPGSFAVTGSLAGIVAARLLSADPGTYNITGEQAGTLAARILAGDPAAISVVGAAATLLGPADEETVARLRTLMGFGI